MKNYIEIHLQVPEAKIIYGILYPLERYRIINDCYNGTDDKQIFVVVRDGQQHALSSLTFKL